jgi:hypothetical protein
MTCFPGKLRLAILLLLPLCGIPAQEISGELMFRAIKNSFPEKTGGLAMEDNDWTIQAGGKTFFWAGGRVLPFAERRNIIHYSPYLFEIYPAMVPSPEIFSARYIAALRRRGSNEVRRDREDQHPGFRAALYGGLEREEIEPLLERIEFLGKKITVHQVIAGALVRIDREIRRTAIEETKQGNRELSAFIAAIGQIGGYNWREISGTRRMSYHSWGLAIDIQPAKPGGKAIYWLWERARNEDWMLVPLKDRWQPPGQVIEAFEREGFIWGGKWPLYDNMHFEYRPELHELGRLLAAEPESPSGSGQELHHIYPEGLSEKSIIKSLCKSRLVF